MACSSARLSLAPQCLSLKLRVTEKVPSLYKMCEFRFDATANLKTFDVPVTDLFSGLFPTFRLVSIKIDFKNVVYPIKKVEE